MENIGGYILTGGKNRRMNGTKKLFLTYEGKSFLQRLTEAMADLSALYLSVDQEESYVGTGLPLIQDLFPETGPMGGICSGLISCKEECLFVSACDMPLLDRETVGKLSSVYQQERKIIVARSEGRIHPLLGLYPKQALPLMRELIEQGDYKMRTLLERAGCREVEIGNQKNVAANINCPQDYQTLLQAGK